jgi:hypothetical protein
MSPGAGAQGGQAIAFWFIAALGLPALALVLFRLKPGFWWMSPGG